MTDSTGKPDVDKHALVAALRRFLPDDMVLHATEDLRAYECDGLSAYKQTPMVAVLPRTIEQIRQIMRTCLELGVPVVARGAGTGLSAGALPLGDGLLLSLARFMSILDIDPVNRTMRVQPGVRNLAISEAAAPYGLYYAPDPSSQIACIIGGNVAENAGGVHCLKYGLTVHNILKVKLVTMDGQLLSFGTDALDAPGFDLLALATGSEGMLGILVEVTVKLIPRPVTARVVLAAFDNVEAAGAAVGAIIAEGIIPAGLEMMDNPTIRAAEAFVHSGYPVDAEAILLCELDGTAEEVADGIDEVTAIMQRCGASMTRVSRDEQERARFWAGRKMAFPAMGRISPDYYCTDGAIPRKHLPRVLRRIQELGKKHDLAVANVFHAGDGNLHPMILYDAGSPGELERAEALGGDILRLCVEVGGTITG
ncbi:MAG TPA: FAD-linked oxidase C-terminal domain-containing protein, partial [Oleiagrimonas sp.]|nr:FAD-linked oxidase C-terminal domain-containing protein [Oleiagrimonas sp.]